MKTKVCSSCREEKDVSQFNKTSCNNDGFDYYCRDCRNEYNKPYRKYLKNRDNNIYKDMDKFVEIFSDIFYDINDVSLQVKNKLYKEYEYILEDGWWEIMTWIKHIRIDNFKKGWLKKPADYLSNFDEKTATFFDKKRKNN